MIIHEEKLSTSSISTKRRAPSITKKIGRKAVDKMQDLLIIDNEGSHLHLQWGCGPQSH